MRIAEKIVGRLNDGFNDALATAFREKHGIEIETGFNIFAMRKVTIRSDKRRMTKAQHTWIGAFESGYLSAMGIARKESR